MISWSMGLMSMSYEADEQAATNRSQQRDVFNLSFAADPVFLSTLSSISFNVQNIFLSIYLEWQVGSGLENESTMIFLRLMRHFSESWNMKEKRSEIWLLSIFQKCRKISFHSVPILFECDPLTFWPLLTLLYCWYHSSESIAANKV